MKVVCRIILLFLLLFGSLDSQASILPDSLLKVWNNAEMSDSIRWNAANEYSKIIHEPSQDSVLLDLYKEFVKETYQKKDQFWYVQARIAEIKTRTDYLNIHPEQDYLNLLKEIEPLKNVELQKDVYFNLCRYLSNRGDDSRQLKYQLDYLEVLEKDHKMTSNYIMQLHRIGEGYQSIDRTDKAMEMYNEALDIANEIEDWNNVGGTHYNLAYLSLEQGDTLGYRHHIKQTHKYAMIGENPPFTAMCKILLSEVFAQEGDFESAYDYNEIGTQYFIEREYPPWISNGLVTKAKIDLLNNNLSSAIKNAEEAYEVAVFGRTMDEQQEALKVLFDAYERSGDYKKAYAYRDTYESNLDSMNFTFQAGEAAATLTQYAADKKAMKDSLEREKVHEMEEMEHQAEIRSQQNLQYVYAAGAGFMLILALVLLRGFRQKKKDNLIIQDQKLEVERQKDEIELQHQEIKDSITYAKRIQTAILPPLEMMQIYLKDFFVLYKPKDVVAGDFYWMEPTDKGVIFAAADCTGHGVPGAMVSVVCNNALNRSVREFGLLDPGKILDKTRELVIEEFDTGFEEVKDGMDIALANLTRTETGATVRFSGAHNPIWVIRKGSKDIEEIKGNKQPIGVFDGFKKFETHELKLNTGDTFYLFSDGYADQFGGDKGKKMKSTNFKRLLLSMEGKDMVSQQEKLDSDFEAWRGAIEQLDDVCVIGVRV